MTSVEDVLTQLKTVIAEIDQAVVAVMRAKAHVTDAHAAFNEAGTGTQDTDMRSAITGADTGGKDLRKVAVLLTQAIQDFADYADIIAPGSGLGSRSDDTMPHGERVVAESEEHGADRWFRRTSKKADEVKDSVAEVGKPIEGGAKTWSKIVRSKTGDAPAGSGVPQTAVPHSQAPTQPHSSAADATAAVVAAALAAVVAGKAIKQRWKQLRDRSP
ncbi:hypothetical protein [Virgisporangium aurantiacum]|uniref:Uncharacterized protein n=1 Tax=Virgisporangium aurantiacum TaxID=175570 RepID=A0A8J3ZD14_9ACTN|nr:hypothetical protein [Virgisporangium aurantiacum]GIJ59465.1 hypothetical protein Vau01_069810 [Virgisporangium aurantiacum]